MRDDFVLHELLVKDCYRIADWPLCRVLLMDDTHYPWLVLVPRVPSAKDLDELDDETLTACMREVSLASRRLKELTKAHKINVAALGNQCPQLHIHIIARYREDAAWPGPVWGKAPLSPYPAATGVFGAMPVEEMLNRLRSSLGTPE